MKVASKRLESELFSISLRIEHAKADTVDVFDCFHSDVFRGFI